MDACKHDRDSPEIMCHRLNIDRQAKPVHQKLRALDAYHYKALQDEVDHLLKIGFIRESYYPDWLANLVLVIKPNRKWRTNIDFKNLNNACPKDSFPLPRIDQLVDAMIGHELLSFMDAYARYNQISMYEPARNIPFSLQIEVSTTTKQCHLASRT